MHPYAVLAALLRPPRRLRGAVLFSGQCAGALMIRTTLGILEESQVRTQGNPYESRHLIPCPRLPCRGGHLSRASHGAAASSDEHHLRDDEGTRGHDPVA